jgi:hypothetical protein
VNLALSIVNAETGGSIFQQQQSFLMFSRINQLCTYETIRYICPESIVNSQKPPDLTKQVIIDVHVLLSAPKIVIATAKHALRPNAESATAG